VNKHSRKVNNPYAEDYIQAVKQAISISERYHNNPHYGNIADDVIDKAHILLTNFAVDELYRREHDKTNSRKRKK
jgi:hypothetical protein